MDKAEKTILVVLLSVVGGCLILGILCGGIFYLAYKFVPEAVTQVPIEIPTFVPDESPTPENLTITEISPTSPGEGEYSTLKTAYEVLKFA